jgi:MFS family permease
MIVTDIIRGLCVGFVATAYLAGFLNQWILLICTVIISSAEAFRGPASASLIPKLLRKEDYDYGLSLNTSASGVAELIGYGAAGIIIASFSISTAIYIDTATFFLSALIILTLRVKEEILAHERIKIKEYIENLKGGFGYLKDKKALRYFLLMSVFLNGILVPLNSLQAPLVSEVLHSGEVMLSVFSIALTLGMIVGAAVYPYVSVKIGSYTMISLGCYSFGAYYFTFVLSGAYLTSTVLLYLVIALSSFIVGVLCALMNTFVYVEFIKNIEENFIARVSAIMGATCVAAMPIVSFMISALAGWTSTATIFIIAGVINVIVCFRLCNKKRFTAIIEDLKEKKVDEEESRVISSC